MKNMLRYLSMLWILVGLMLGLWCAKGMYESYQYFHFISGAFKASMIGLVYAILAIMAGQLVWFRKPWGRFLFNTVSILAILYSLMFVLFHGYLDRPLLYSACVSTLCIISVISIIAVNGNSFRKAYSTQLGTSPDGYRHR